MTHVDKTLVVLSCPYHLVRSPAVGYVSEVYEWREAGGVQMDAVPVPVRRAVTAFGRGINRRRQHDFREQEREAERERERNARR